MKRVPTQTSIEIARNDESDTSYSDSSASVSTYTFGGHQTFIPSKEDTTHQLYITCIGWIVRCFLLLCTLFCILLCFIYAAGQLYELSMTNFWCTENYKLSEIHEHNRLIGLERGDIWSCWSIGSESFVDESALHSNALDIYESTLNITLKSVLFSALYGLCGMLFAISFCYHFYQLSRDLCGRNTFKPQKTKKESNNKCCFKITTMIHSVAKQWSATCGTDAFGWILRKYILEIVEIALQSMVLLEYGGNSIYGGNSVKLAEHPHHVINFAIILGSNCIMNGILWMSYACFPTVCHGVMFAEMITVIDIIFDSLYVVYPLFIAGSMSLEAFALYKIDTLLRFVASFVPQFTLFLGLTRSLSSLTAWMREDGDTVQSYSFIVQAPMEGEEDDDSDTNISSAYTNRKKQNCCLLDGILFMLFGIGIIFFVTYDISQSSEYCTEGNHDIDGLYPELALYNDLCQYKVYKLFNVDSSQPYQCQCRLLVLSETKSNCEAAKDILSERDNSTQSDDIFIRMLERWNMLQVVILQNCIGFHETFNLQNTQTFSASNMQAFGIYDFEINRIDGNISLWKDSLEFLELSNTNLYYDDIDWDDGISTLTNLKYFSLYRNSIDMWPQSICYMKQLLFLEISGSNNLVSIDECITNLHHLRKIYLSWTGLQSIPSAVWTLPNIEEMQFAFAENITLQSSNILSIPEIPPKLTKLYFQGSPLCAQFETVSNLSVSHPMAYSMITDLNSCHVVCEKGSVYEQLCLPWAHGDGICNDVCNVKECNFDRGDCNQLCEFNECDVDKHWNNGICDMQCNSTKCGWDKGDCNGINNVMVECGNECDEMWLNDNWCDQSCMESNCRDREATDCNECVKESPCDLWSLYFGTVDLNNDGFLEEWEVCNAWNLLKDLIAVENCNEMTNTKYDLNYDGKLNAYEALQLGINSHKLSSLMMDSVKAEQLNCSVCMDHPSLYNA